MDTKEEKQKTQINKRGEESESGVVEKANQGRKCDPAVEDISDIGRALSASQKKTRTQI